MGGRASFVLFAGPRASAAAPWPSTAGVVFPPPSAVTAGPTPISALSVSPVDAAHPSNASASVPALPRAMALGVIPTGRSRQPSVTPILDVRGSAKACGRGEFELIYRRAYRDVEREL